jgi:hypothetical protein
MKAERACLYIMYIKDTKAEATNQMASYLSFKESRKESTLQSQPKHHLLKRTFSYFSLFLLDRALSRSQAHPMQYHKAEHPNKREKGWGEAF